MQTHEERVESVCKDNYTEVLQNKLKEATIDESLKASNFNHFKNDFFPILNHLEVYQQHKGNLCGFHAYHNAKCFVKAIMSPSLEGKVGHLTGMKDYYYLMKEYDRVIAHLIKCSNVFYVNNQDKERLQEGDPLERNHLRYLLMTDPDVLPLLNSTKVNVRMKPFLFAFGLFQQTIE